MAKANSTSNSEPATLVKVTLLLPHTHGGMDYFVGDQIDVTEAQEAWLEQRGIIAPQTQTQSGE